MRTFQTTRHVAHSAQQMFDLVADVERYPEFLPLCQALKLRDRQENGGKEVLVADMTVAYKLFCETFTSRVTLDRDTPQILVEYLDGPFTHLENRWTFRDTGEGTSDIEFYLAYEFRSRSLQMLMGAMFDQAFRRFAEAFEERADSVYGTSRRQAQAPGVPS
ncbi:MAG: type II toxin-antitoxin system RatA family toxin [Hyphomicrobiaceae bacterium]|nr:type II toxin-antitoxin system RatA family toxin [Hyphomicrobiaceae bacterium]